MKNKRFFRATCVFVALISVGLGVGYYYGSYYLQEQVPEITGLLWPGPKQLQPFATIDMDGKVFGIDELKSHWSFLFFGYTHCPDVCPITLAVLNDVRQRLAAVGMVDDVQFIFVTVDPERDTQEQLKQYTGYFNPDLIGLGGNMAQVTSLTSQLGVVFLYGDKSADGGYIVDHTASVFLTDPMGRIVGIFSAPHSADSIMGRYLEIRQFVDSQI